MTDIYLNKPIEKIDIVKLSYLTGREHSCITTSLDEPTIDKKEKEDKK